MKKYFLLPLLFIAAIFTRSGAQTGIVYANADKADIKRMNFDIIGKVANNYLIYKEIKGRKIISVYDENMQPLDNVPISVLPLGGELLDIVFYPEGRHIYMLYQYQQGDVVYCMAARVEPNGHIAEDTKLLDTTMISYSAKGKIYNHVTCADHSKILIYKINRKNKSLYRVSTMLFDDDLNLVDKSAFSMPMEKKGDYLSGYSLDNEGNFVFVKYNRMTNGSIDEADIIIKPVKTNTYTSRSLNLGNTFLDDIKVKVDDQNNRYLLTSLFSEQKKGNIKGIYISSWVRQSATLEFEKTTLFSDEFMKKAKGSSGKKSAFDQYFINNIMLTGQGSFVVSAEALYTGGSSWDRWGYWGSPYYSMWAYPYGGYWGGFYGGGNWGRWTPYFYSPYYYYSPFFYRSYWWGNDWYGGNVPRFHADNIAVMSFDRQGNKTWDNVIAKRQSSDETDGTISYQVLQEGDGIHFLIDNTGKISGMQNIVIDQDGKIETAKPLNAPDKKMAFMPRYAKQVGPSQVMVPFVYKKQIGFAVVRF